MYQREALAELSGKEEAFAMTSRGSEKLIAGLKKSCLAPELLKLKAEAQVMFLKNAPDGSYVNGTRGVIEGFDRSNRWPVVRTFDGDSIIAEPQEWRYEENDVVEAALNQVRFVSLGQSPFIRVKG